MRFVVAQRGEILMHMGAYSNSTNFGVKSLKNGETFPSHVRDKNISDMIAMFPRTPKIIITLYLRYHYFYYYSETWFDN